MSGNDQIEAHLVPFAAAAARLDEIPGIGPVAAAVIIAEVGVDMSRFPTAGHLCSWAKLSPGLNTSAGKTKGNGSTGHGNRYLARILGEAAVTAGRTDTFLGARYRRIAKRRGRCSIGWATGYPVRPSMGLTRGEWVHSGSMLFTDKLWSEYCADSLITIGPGTPASPARSATTPRWT